MGEQTVLRKIVLMVLSFLIGLCIANGRAFSQKAENHDGSIERSSAMTGEAKDDLSEYGGVAVVELFTSQGCSSCPPADRVLRELAADARQDNRSVYALSFHVDYWNYLGWKDPYSLAESTQRQKIYAAAMDSDRVYTPQMIVNGQQQFNGGDKKTATGAVTEALDSHATTKIEIVASAGQDSGTVKVDWRLSGDTEDRLLNLAVVAGQQQNEVPRGENRGSKLQHVNVVRAFDVVRVKEKSGGTTVLELPDDVDASKLRVIAYVQQRTTAAITGAAATRIQ